MLDIGTLAIDCLHLLHYFCNSNDVAVQYGPTRLRMHSLLLYAIIQHIYHVHISLSNISTYSQDHQLEMVITNNPHHSSPLDTDAIYPVT